MKSFLRKISSVVFGLFLCILSLELCLRAGGFIFLSYQEYRNTLSAKQKGAYRILCLGESTTANTWPGILEKILNEKNTGIKFSVIDKGKTSTNTRVILEQVESYLDEYHPDAVVAMMGINDEGVRYYQDIPEANTWMFRHCQVYKFGRILCMHILKKIRYGDIYGSDRSNSEGRVNPEAARTVFKEMNLPASERDNHYARANIHSIHPVILKNTEMKTVAAEPAAKLEVNGKSSDKEIEKSYLEAIKEHPEDQMLYLSLATFYESKGMFHEAEKTHLEGIKVNPEGYEGFFALGLLYEHSGDNDKA